jgi:hypothetical protein
MQDITKKTKEERFREMAKDGIVCQSLDCPIREHCLRSILKDYVPEHTHVTTVINLRNPKMQSADCPRYCPDEPLRMPIGLTHMYYDMPGHLERSIKNRLISIFSRKRYYIYHGGRRPITPDIEETIRQTLLAFGWTAEPVFDGYVEEYLW